jgi:plastocyanin
MTKEMQMKRLFTVFPIAIVTLVIAGGCFGAENINVQITDFAFKPEILKIKAGTTINWVNNDSAPHTITSNDAAWDSGKMPKAATYNHQFDKIGTFEYHCAYHSSMKGTVVVSP